MTKKKATKTKNIRLKRQIRKTIGALFMASAVTVAALPVQDVSATPGVDATPEVAHGIAVIMCLIAGGSVVIAGLINLFFYHLNEKKVDQMTEEINAR